MLLLLLCLVAPILADQNSNTPPNWTGALQEKSLTKLLHQCCKTQDGFQRDCCRLVYPNLTDHDLQCSCPASAKTQNPRTHFAPFPGYFDHFHFSHFFHGRSAHPSGAPSTKCHPITQNLMVATQRLLHQCCYVPVEVALDSGLDCLALTFPSLPKEERCGECTTPGTMQDLIYECCNADDGIERDCCALLSPYKGRTKSLVKPFCPCPKKVKPQAQAKVTVQITHIQSGISDSGEVNSRKRREVKCHESTKNISVATQRLLNKCCLTDQVWGAKPKIDCLGVAFPNLPWEERCGSCDSELPPKDLMNECCGTRDGIPRDCCQLVYPKVPKHLRVCPCRATGSKEQARIIEGPTAPRNYFNSPPFDIYNLAGSRYTGFQGIYNVGATCPIQSPEPAVNLHTFCCNTYGKKELGFTCERIVLGKEPDHGNRPCGAWSNTLDPTEPTVQGNTDYLDYDD